MKYFKHTKEQKKIFGYTLGWEINQPNGTTVLIVDAKAGTGKSTTIEHDAIKRAGRPRKFSTYNVSFGRDIANEMSDRFYRTIGIKNISGTFNAVGWKKLKQHLNINYIKINKWKNTNIIMGNKFDVNAPKLHKAKFDGKIYDPTKFANELDNLIAKCKHHAIVPIFDDNDSRRLYVKFSDSVLTIELLQSLIDWYGVDTQCPIDVLYQWVSEALRISISLVYAHKPQIDFDDQIYCPVIFNLDLDRYQIVYVDEVQDVSLIQRIFLLKMLDKTCALLVAVGDENQAIFGFRGADTQSIQQFKETFGNPKMLPLTLNMRCSKTVIREAQNIVPKIRYRDDAPEGNVGLLNHDVITEWKNTSNTSEARDDNMIICRNNAPLFELAYKLIKQNIRINFLGKDLSYELIKIIEKVNESITKMNNEPGNPYADVKMTFWKLSFENYINEHVRILKERENWDGMSNFMDKVEVLKIFINKENPNGSHKLIDKIQDFFDTNSTGQHDRVSKYGIRLATIHKSKGLEATNVFILRPDLIPSKYAKKDWQLKQEKNLAYVGITRAKTNLYYVDLFNFSEKLENQKKSKDKLASARASFLKMKTTLDGG